MSSAIYTLTLTWMYFVYALLATVSMAIVLVNFQPYKHSVTHCTTIDVSFMLLLSLFNVTIVKKQVGIPSGKRLEYTLNGLAAISCIIPIIYTNLIAINWIYVYSKRKWRGMFLTRVSVMMKRQLSSN